MATFFLLIIYLAFISLGLPDSILGAAWPVMQGDLGEPMDRAGLLFMTIAAGTIVSSLASGKILNRFGTGPVTFVSCLMTAGGLLGFSIAPSLIWLMVCAIPLGLGAGAIDTGLNNYVAVHYKAHHMSWLHCFWGVGATLGPIIMAQSISADHSWRNGYLMIALIQLALAAVLFFTLPLWKRAADKSESADRAEGETEQPTGEQVKAYKIKGVYLALLSFLFYCGAEAAMGLWGSSFLVNMKGLPAATAAQWVSLYYGGITIGRFITGFITLKVSNRVLILAGQGVALAGAALLMLPLPAGYALAGFVLTGLGLAPIFPCMMHETPVHFGKAHSQNIVGYQMAFAFTGNTFLPPLLGMVSAHTTIGIFPLFIVAAIAAMMFSSERLNRIMKEKRKWKEGNEAAL
ncbi:MFS transporter [Bacillus sp. FJAT-42376]|uniref:MFS transporter n=1 Tax=Bacillus sp. FJAT-42376 TaxID=2014076 RepID=UPI000F4E4261|nr:MFS transporter [Bacillus sp. FJAT-42376]AZB43997.1 MFS transporter [Bacillus sp. FJAT-42376]